jgi:hypothetical protein
VTRTKLLALAGVFVLIAMIIPAAVLALHHGPSSNSAQRASVGRTSASPETAPSADIPTPTPTPSPTPVVTVQSAPVPLATPRPTYVSYFITLPPGSALPSDAQCARQIAGNPWEPRPQNRTANQTNAWAQGFRLRNSYLASYGPGYENRVTGNYTGTTDQILRWGACKWGFDENTVRAQAVVESWWRQSTLGDCGGGATQPATNGCASVGILQVKGADIPATHPGTWPAAWTSTSFNVDYTLAVRRLCYEGKETWLRDRNPTYAAGDLWGCIGRWFSGSWHDPGANQYIQKVQGAMAAKTWTTF